MKKSAERCGNPPQPANEIALEYNRNRVREACSETRNQLKISQRCRLAGFAPGFGLDRITLAFQVSHAERSLGWVITCVVHRFVHCAVACVAAVSKACLYCERGCRSGPRCCKWTTNPNAGSCRNFLCMYLCTISSELHVACEAYAHASPPPSGCGSSGR